MKIYYAKSKQVPKDQADKELKFLKKHFKDHKILYYMDGPYNPEILDSCDMVIVTSTNYRFLVGRGIANQVVSAENGGKPIYILDTDQEGGYYLRLYEGYNIVDPKEWKDGYVRINPGTIIDIDELLKDGKQKE